MTCAQHRSVKTGEAERERKHGELCALALPWRVHLGGVAVHRTRVPVCHRREMQLMQDCTPLCSPYHVAKSHRLIRRTDAIKRRGHPAIHLPSWCMQRHLRRHPDVPKANSTPRRNAWSEVGGVPTIPAQCHAPRFCRRRCCSQRPRSLENGCDRSICKLSCRYPLERCCKG